MDAQPKVAGFGGVEALAGGTQLPGPRLVIPWHLPDQRQPLATDNGPPGSSPPRGAVGKTPISVLQEACLRRKTSPAYELVSTQGQVHEPTFMYRCTVDGIMGQGQGKSKKLAKHLAAKAVLDEVVGRQLHLDWGIPGRTATEAREYIQGLMTEQRKPEADSEKADAEEAGNPVGRLQERCTQLKLPIPEYELEEEIGQPHNRLYKVAVRLGKLTSRAEERSKKLAKRKAAELMLTQIADTSSNLGFDEDDLVEEEELEPGAAYPASLEEQLSLSAAVAPLSVTEEAECVAGAGLEELLSADLRRHVPSEATVDWLRAVASDPADPGDPVSFRLLDRISVEGEVQCLVQLSTMPVAVCHGTGPTEREAQYDAAKNALQYLKIMGTKAQEAC